MSIRSVPPHVRVLLYLFWGSMALAALGIVGFFLSYGQVGSPAQATIDVHTEMPKIAYASIGAWTLGMLLMWYSRRRLHSVVQKRQQEMLDAARVDPEAVLTPAPVAAAEFAVDASAGREP